MGTQRIDLGVYRELQDTAGEDFVNELVATFFEEAPPMLAQLRQALSAGDESPFRRAAHSLKSNSLTFGATALAERARQLELGGSAAAVPDALRGLELEYQRVADALRELRHG